MSGEEENHEAEQQAALNETSLGALLHIALNCGNRRQMLVESFCCLYIEKHLEV